MVILRGCEKLEIADIQVWADFDFEVDVEILELASHICTFKCETTTAAYVNNHIYRTKMMVSFILANLLILIDKKTNI